MEQLRWRIQQRKNSRDIQAYNVLARYIKAQDYECCQQHILFAKMFTHYFLKYASLGHLTADDILHKIEQIVGTPWSHMVKELSHDIPRFKFNTLMFKGTGHLDPSKPKDAKEWQEIVASNVALNKAELVKAMRTEYTLEEATRFIEHQVNKFVREYGHLQ